MKVPEQIPKIEYKKILYTTDLSESGRYAFPHAASMARCSGAELVVLHVVEGTFGTVQSYLCNDASTPDEISVQFSPLSVEYSILTLSTFSLVQVMV